MISSVDMLLNLTLNVTEYIRIILNYKTYFKRNTFLFYDILLTNRT